jgi:putative ABC transport system permease protein
VDLPGVVAAGLFWSVDQQASVATLPSSNLSYQMPVFAASAGAMKALPAVVHVGRTFDAGMVRRADDVAVLGVAAARSLGIANPASSPAIFINGSPFTVIGIVSSLEREPQALLGIIIPSSVAAALNPGQEPQDEQLLVSTRQGAAQVVGGEVALAEDPQQPQNLDVSVPPNPSTLKQQVEGTTSTLLLTLGCLSLLVGLIAIMNTTLLAVLERSPEIGLRRALGARRIHIGVGTLIESCITGALGGVVGTTLGVLVTSGTALYEQWTAVLDYRVVLVAPLLGVLVGLIAGAYPAWRAANLTPVAALQR